MAVRGLHDRDFCPDAVEPHDTIHPPVLDRPPPCSSGPGREVGCTIQQHVGVGLDLDRVGLPGGLGRHPADLGVMV